MLSGETELSGLLAARPELHDVLRSLDPAGDAADAPTLAAFAATLGLPVAAVIAAMSGELPAACARRAEASAIGTGATGTGAARTSDAEAEPEPAWLAGFDRATAPTIDVRPLIAARRDPFLAVIAEVARVPPGGGLIIEAPFDPQPLRRVLAGRGFATHARTEAPGHVRVWCRRAGDGAAEPSATATAGRNAAGRIWEEGDRVHVDVRGLPPPQPMTAILRLIDHGPHRGAIVVHHEREPVYLLPELAERGWSAEMLPGDGTEVRLLLRREGG